ncbi:MAG: gliding motility protein GldC [Bacteroidota bacterium]|nr:gliding motility protein GldC [Bacteroidota bacterium]
MKKSDINFSIDLDEANIPEKIIWNATEKEEDLPSETKAISIALWDHALKNTLRIDLWTKDMPVDEMKRFYIDSIGGLAQSILNATGDEYMSNEIQLLCDRFIVHLENESKKATN